MRYPPDMSDSREERDDDDDPRPPRVSDTDEFALIDLLRDALPPSVREPDGVALGIGDDAAAWTPAPGSTVLISTDSLIERIHFRLDWSTWADIGHRALAVNLSDIAAMGVTPALATIGLGLTGQETVADVVSAYRALGALAERSGCAVAGGDIVASPTAVLWHVTVLGAAAAGRMLTRAGARPGDLIVVSGTLGAAAAGVELLRAGPDDPRRRATTADQLLLAHRRPEPRLALGRVLLDGGATAAMDLSDGLFGDIPKLLVASDVAAEIDEPSVPVAAAVRALFPDRWFDLATRGGEDFELLATVPPDRFDALADAALAIGSTLTRIGTVLPLRPDQPRLRLRDSNGRVRPVREGAYRHFD